MGLFSESNFWIFLFSFLPGLIYSFIVFASTPYRSVRLKYAFNYLFIGFLSAIFVLGFHLLFPNWTNIAFGDVTHIPGFGTITAPTLLSVFFLAFIQVAFIEELAKLTTFRIADFRNKEENPVDTMFNFMMIGTGFAVVENILYAFNYGGEVLLVRNFTALIVHMTLGIIFGYFVALSKMNTEKTGEMSFHSFLREHPKWKKGIYAGIGLLVATFLHGLYDLNLFIKHDNSDFYCYLILGAALYFSYRAANHLYQLYNKKK